MSRLLYRLGRTAYRRRGIVVAVWALILAALITTVATAGGSLDKDFTIPGSQSQQALDTMAVQFPAAAGTSAQIVFTAPDGTLITDPANVAAVRQTLSAAGQAPQVDAVVDPYQVGALSADKTTALAQVQFSVDRSGLDDGSLDALEQAVAPGQATSLHIDVGGQAYGSGMVSVSAKELLGVAVALLVLTITFGSLYAAGAPLLTAFVGVGVGLTGLLATSTIVSVSPTAVTLALMLGLAVGIDYALFILSRHRAQLADGLPPEESAALATATAGGAVTFAGLTVVIALAGLSVVRIPFLTVMGLGAAATVLIAVLVAVTLLPALMGFAGARLAPRSGSRAARLADGDHITLGARWFRLVTRRPLLTVIAVAGLLAVMAIPATGLRLALPDNGTAAHDSTQRQAYDTVSDKFGPGFNGPLLILVEGGGQPAATTVATNLQQTPGVAAVAPPQLDPTGHNAVIQLVPTSGPQDQATQNLVEDLRAAAPTLEAQTGTQIAVTGATAVDIDVSARLADSLLPFAAVVVGLSLLLLLVVFRSVIVPIKAAAGFLLSVAASFGAVVAVFQWGWLADWLGAQPGPVVSFLPIILMAVLFGLAMDYEVFLVSRMREEWTRTRDARSAVVHGGRHAARVVTAAALIMFCVFASFVTTEDTIIKPIAFALAVGVAIDAFAVRMTLVPAVLALAGRWGWWLPRWLDRLLPQLDLEGERLTHEQSEPAAADGPESVTAGR